MSRFNEHGEKLAKLECHKCKRKMEQSSATKTFDPEGFAKFVAEYKFFWKSIDHDTWLSEFKKVFDKKYQETFWNQYATFKPEFKEKKEIDDAWEAYSKAEGTNNA